MATLVAKLQQAVRTSHCKPRKARQLPSQLEKLTRRPLRVGHSARRKSGKAGRQKQYEKSFDGKRAALHRALHNQPKKQRQQQQTQYCCQDYTNNESF
ncbi:unnamed protein product [Ceratitis capitata]|uniref:(Mediterranean fruit fly) hypothetical protein n=1 Tax=Ceratitis capitata TaxID=7213 RepID=A0A811V658_CERCA|nr:unnamed protein product [Ceratitis capitata]